MEKTMDRDKMMKQAKILRDKKTARMATLAKELRPRVENGIVTYDHPVPRSSEQVRAFSAPPAKPARSVSKQTQTTATQVQPQQVNSHKVVRQQTKGCSGCKRKIGK